MLRTERSACYLLQALLLFLPTACFAGLRALRYTSIRHGQTSRVRFSQKKAPLADSFDSGHAD